MSRLGNNPTATEPSKRGNATPSDDIRQELQFTSMNIQKADWDSEELMQHPGGAAIELSGLAGALAALDADFILSFIFRFSSSRWCTYATMSAQDAGPRLPSEGGQALALSKTYENTSSPTNKHGH